MSDLAPSQQPISNRWSSLVTACLLLLLLLLVLILYTLFHEGGHAIVGLLFGGKIIRFSVNFFNLSAHVGIDGNFSSTQNALISAAGVSLPVLVCMAFILLTPRKTEPVLGWFRLISFMAAINALLAWVVIPVLVMQGQTVSDDSFNFLNYTQLHPLLVSGAALLVYLACWWLFLRHVGGFKALVEMVRSPAYDVHHNQTRRNLLALAALGVIAGAAAVALPAIFPEKGFQAPDGYNQISEIQFVQGGQKDLLIHAFTLERPASVSFFFAFANVRGGPIHLHLTGPNGYDNVFFDNLNPQVKMGAASVHPQNIPLEPGEYSIRISAGSNSGLMRSYIRIKDIQTSK